MTPRATYRLQLGPGFGFDEAAAVAPYLARLGGSHVYCSPYLQATAGSTHGYDVVDHTRVNDELGGADGHARFCTAVGQAGLGQVLDIVPNHMAIGAGNAWWWDVLENGPSSLYASHFDVDWDPPESKLRNTVLIPVLGDHYGRVLERGEITLHREGGRFEIRYFEHRYPVAPRTLGVVLAGAAERADSDDLAFLAGAHQALPLATATDRASVRRRHRDKEVVARQLERLCAEHPAAAAAVDEEVAAINADPDRLDDLLDRQNHRLAFWRTAQRELDYRRFFDIATLVGLRVEDEQVFADTHELVLAWLGDGTLDGLRIDHPDGLLDPVAYFERLRAAAPGAWIVVEKIVEPDEELPASWPVEGTTGYDFARLATGLFVDPAAEAAFDSLYTELTGDDRPYEAVVLEAKHQVMRDVLATDVTRLTNLLVQVVERHRRWRDHTRHDLHEAVREVIAALPVYRTYIRPGVPPSQPDLAHLRRAVETARSRRDDLEPELFDVLHTLVRGEVDGHLEAELLARFQQLTGPVMAKGVEDTTFYRYLRFVALNEVGGDPGRFGASPEEVHTALERAHERWPGAMLTTSTHDTKRSEDVRARLAVLSEVPERWAAAVRRWSSAAERHRVDGWPDAATGYLLWQTLVGAWPIDAGRTVTYMEKATREAKLHTSWIDQDPTYDEALRRYTEAVLADRQIVADVEAFVADLLEPGWVTSLAQILLKLTAPGVPDVYQGCELWDLSLVDPDNRRPVDFALRQRLLDELDAGLPADEIWKRAPEGLPKLHVTRQALQLRRRRPAAFGAGAAGRYERLPTSGRHAARLFGSCRGGRVATVVPRLVAGVAGAWGDTTVTLPPGRWRDVLSGSALEGGDVPAGTLFDTFPVSLLEREADGG